MSADYVEVSHAGSGSSVDVVGILDNCLLTVLESHQTPEALHFSLLSNLICYEEQGWNDLSRRWPEIARDRHWQQWQHPRLELLGVPGAHGGSVPG
jgi:hypothetical protein